MTPTHEKEETAPNMPVAAGTGQSPRSGFILPSGEQECKVESADYALQLQDVGGGLFAATMTNILDSSFAPRAEIVSDLLVSGAYLLVGAPKVGKSFFSLQLSYCVSTGQPFLGHNTSQGDVLYLALEDDFSRLQARYMKMCGTDDNDHLLLATQSKSLSEGLMDQLASFAEEHTNAKLIVVDTLACIRDISSEYSYSVDYNIIKTIQQFAAKYRIAVVIVHHSRKMGSDDPFDLISGTNGQLGAVDGAWILQRPKRAQSGAILNITARDLPSQELQLETDDTCKWQVISDSSGNPVPVYDALVLKIQDMLSNSEASDWEGTATELMTALGYTSNVITAHALTRRLNGLTSQMDKLGIHYTSRRTATARTIHLSCCSVS